MHVVHTIETVCPAVFTVQFNPSSYSVSEGGQVQLVVVLSLPADRDLTMNFTTVSGTATGTYAPTCALKHVFRMLNYNV